MAESSVCASDKTSVSFPLHLRINHLAWLDVPFAYTAESGGVNGNGVNGRLDSADLVRESMIVRRQAGKSDKTGLTRLNH